MQMAGTYYAQSRSSGVCTSAISIKQGRRHVCLCGGERSSHLALSHRALTLSSGMISHRLSISICLVRERGGGIERHACVLSSPSTTHSDRIAVHTREYVWYARNECQCTPPMVCKRLYITTMAHGMGNIPIKVGLHLAHR